MYKIIPINQGMNFAIFKQVPMNNFESCKEFFYQQISPPYQSLKRCQGFLKHLMNK